MLKDGIIRLNEGIVAVEANVDYYLSCGQHNPRHIDSHFTVAPLARVVTDEDHICKPDQLSE